MGSIRRRCLVGLLLAASAALTGCKGEDADRLAKVGRTLRAKMQGAGGANGNITRSLRADLDALTLDARIGARLRWDKSLQDVHLEVRGTGGEVELHGAVADDAQRQRALEVARSTIGVDKVTDAMELSKRNP